MTVLLLAAIACFAADRFAKRVAEGLAEGRVVLEPTRHLRLVPPKVRERPAMDVRHGLGALGALGAYALLLELLGPGTASPIALLGLGAALGGAAANLLDIAFREGVRDVLELRGVSYLNLADVGIVGGLALALCATVL